MNKVLFFVFFTFCIIVAVGCGRDENSTKEESEKLSSINRTDKIDEIESDTERKAPDSTYSGGGKNNLPQISSIKIIDASEDDIAKGFKAVVEGKDIDGDEMSLRYQWKRNGEDLVGAVGEVLEWQEDFKKGDNIAVEVIPFDGKDEGVWKTEGGFIIPNSPPKIVSEPEARMEGGKFSYTVKAEDPDGDPVEFTLKNAPEGMAIEPSTGIITWEFEEKDVGEYKTEVIASDPEGAEDVQIVNLTIPSETP